MVVVDNALTTARTAPKTNEVIDLTRFFLTGVLDPPRLESFVRKHLKQALSSKDFTSLTTVL